MPERRRSTTVISTDHHHQRRPQQRGYHRYAQYRETHIGAPARDKTRSITPPNTLGPYTMRFIATLLAVAAVIAAVTAGPIDPERRKCLSCSDDGPCCFD
jgi:hypothetical protein